MSQTKSCQKPKETWEKGVPWQGKRGRGKEKRRGRERRGQRSEQRWDGGQGEVAMEPSGEEERRGRKRGKARGFYSPQCEEAQACAGANVPSEHPCASTGKEERKRKKMRKRGRGRMGKKRDKLKKASRARLGLIRYTKNSCQATKTAGYCETISKTRTKYV